MATFSMYFHLSKHDHSCSKIEGTIEEHVLRHNYALLREYVL